VETGPSAQLVHAGPVLQYERDLALQKEFPLPISQWKSLRNSKRDPQHIIILNGQTETYQREHFNPDSSQDGESEQRSGQNMESRRDKGKDGVLDIYRSGGVAKSTEGAG